MNDEVVFENVKLYEQYRNKEKEITIEPDDVTRMNRPFTIYGKVIIFLSSIVYIFAVWSFTDRSEEWYLLGGIMFAYLLFKIVSVLFYNPSRARLTKDYKVSVIITCYNEDPKSIMAVFDNILALDYPVHEIVFLDDGSTDTTAYEVAKSFAENHQNLPNAPKYTILRFTENRGKRAVMVEGFNHASGDYVFMLDSDSEVLPNALTELLRPFEDARTTSSVGHIGVLNMRDNFLTRIQAFTYYNAFQLGRAAQSVTGNVVICSGAFSLHKRDFILKRLGAFKASRVFGVTVSAGDDRELTSFSKESGGRTVYQNTAYCATIVPNKWSKFFAQRRRWQRSAYLVSLGTIRDMFPRRLGFLCWVFAEAHFWLIALILTIFFALTRGFSFDMRDFFIWTSIMLYKHNGLYLMFRPLQFFVIPLYTLVYGTSLIFTRIHALVTIRNDRWGTRDINTKVADHV